MSLLKRQKRKARRHYQQVWALMNSRSRTDGNSHGRADEFFGAPVILGVSSKHDVYAAYTAVQHDYYSPSSVITHISPKQVLKPRLSISLRKIVARDHKLIGAP